MSNSITIRLEAPQDYEAVESLTRDAFWHYDTPKMECDEHYLAHLLRTDETFVPELDFVAEIDGTVVGNIMYSRAKVVLPDGAEHESLLFGPLSVLPGYQRQGVGSALVRHSSDIAREMGFTEIVIYGSSAYYGRFGFRPASDFGITPPDGKPLPALQVLTLQDGALSGISGAFYEAPVFTSMNQADVEAFDRRFPPK